MVVFIARIYPPNDEHTLRTTAQMSTWALVAEQTNVPQYGVKGRLVLGEHIDFPQCVPIDYMYSILEGVFKFHSKPYSLRKHISKIDKMVSEIKPPNEIQRLPRSINHMSYFKAT